jgi:hypothetical protein
VSETVVEALTAELERFGDVSEPGFRILSASAMSLARELDSDSSATSKSMCAKAMIETVDRLRYWLPDDEENDELDDLAEKRASRLERAAKAQ